MKHWRGIDRQVGEHRISFIQLSATAPLRDHCTEWYTTQVLRVVRRHFTPDSFHSLPLRRGSEASSRCRALSDLGLPVPYYFYTFNFPTPATLAPPHYSLCSFFLEQSADRLHLRNFPLRYFPYAVQLSPVPLAPFSSLRSPATNGGSVSGFWRVKLLLAQN